MADADPVPPKKTKGQQKIEVKAMDDAKKRSVTFTKRKAGLFRKADQLCNLTGAEVALMVISPGGKPYTFGNPDMDTVIARYKSHGPASVTLERQKAKLREIMEQLVYEDRRAQQLRNNRRQMMAETWMAAPTQTYSRPQQETMRERMEQLGNVLSLDFNSFGLGWPPPDSALLELHPNSGLPCGSFMAPVTKSQNFGGDVVLTPSGNFDTGESSLAGAAGSQNLMFPDNTMMNTHGSFYTGESSSMALAGTQNQMSGGNIICIPPDNFYTAEPSSMVPAENQNHNFEYSMFVTPPSSFYTGEPPSMLPAENHTRDFEDNRIVKPPGSFYTGEPSSRLLAENQNHVFEDNMMVTSPANFYTGESSSSMVLAETLNGHMFQNNMMLDNSSSFYTCESSPMTPEAQSMMFDDKNNMIFSSNDNFFTGGLLSEEPTLNQIIDENIRILPNDNFHICGPSVATPSPADENQIFDENIMILPSDNFYTCGSSAVVPPPPPAEVNQIFDENNMTSPPHDNYNTFESSVVPATDDNLFSVEDLRFFLDDNDQFYGNSSSSMLPPADNHQMFDGYVVAPSQQPPPCDGYVAGLSGFN